VFTNFAPGNIDEGSNGGRAYRIGRCCLGASVVVRAHGARARDDRGIEYVAVVDELPEPSGFNGHRFGMN
jgi:hypothetical protein